MAGWNDDPILVFGRIDLINRSLPILVYAIGGSRGVLSEELRATLQFGDPRVAAERELILVVRLEIVLS